MKTTGWQGRPQSDLTGARENPQRLGEDPSGLEGPTEPLLPSCAAHRGTGAAEHTHTYRGGEVQPRK